LPLQDFQNEGVFDLERFVKEIAAAFESLAGVRSVIDGYLAEHPKAHPLAPLLRRALILDLETWGPGKPDEIVEVGLILAAYDSDSGELVGVLDRYEGLRDPGRRSTATPSGRITRQMVAGKGLASERVESLIAQSDVIISHNGFGFDKPRFERLFPSSRSRRWLCSYRDLPWSSSGSDPANLPDLCERHGVKNRDAHRAMPDAEALLQLLAQKHGAISYFAELIGSAPADKVSAHAVAVRRRSK
jgi:DNA polymerase-3 subunit epsilon